MVAAALLLGIVAHAEEPVARAPVEQDLVLEAERTSPATIQPGQLVELRARIVNRSTERAHPVVRLGDGSESGWREPHVFYTAETRGADGTWREVPKLATWGRCGLYDAKWQDDVLVLRPGGSLDLRDWLVSPSQMLDFQEPGLVRLRVHYRYSAGRGSSRSAIADAAKPDTGRMGELPPFELVAEPVEFEVVRPLEVVVRAREALRPGEPRRLSQLVEVRLENRSAETIAVASRQWRVLLAVAPSLPAEYADADEAARRAKPIELAPGQHVQLLGQDGVAGGWDVTFTAPKTGLSEVTLTLTFYDSGVNGSRIRAAPVVLRVER